jgi:hypothetical protein
MWTEWKTALRIPLGGVAASPDGAYRGWVVAVFVSYQAAYKWGTWDYEYLPAGGRVTGQRFYLLATGGGGSVLIGEADIVSCSALRCREAEAARVVGAAAISVLGDAGLVEAAEGVREPAAAIAKRAAGVGRGARPKSALRRRRPVIGLEP